MPLTSAMQALESKWLRLQNRRLHVATKALTLRTPAQEKPCLVIYTQIKYCIHNYKSCF